METAVNAATPIAFGRRAVHSEGFMDLFRAGMQLVEDTAMYVDGAGRSESRELGRILALTYSSESMALTTRLMQMASWLLLHRAFREGELNGENAAKQARDVRLGSMMRAEDPSPELPSALLDLIARADAISRRILALHGSLYGPVEIKPEKAADTVRTALRKAYEES